MVALCRILIGENMLQKRRSADAATFRSGYAVFLADSSFFRSGCPIFRFKGVDPAVETCPIINLSINTCIISRVNSFMRDPVSLRASS